MVCVQEFGEGGVRIGNSGLSSISRHSEDVFGNGIQADGFYVNHRQETE